jgi:hypothetical protein
MNTRHLLYGETMRMASDAAMHDILLTRRKGASALWRTLAVRRESGEMISCGDCSEHRAEPTWRSAATVKLCSEISSTDVVSKRPSMQRDRQTLRHASNEVNLKEPCALSLTYTLMKSETK